jgi:hypothetical protein
MFSWGSLVEFVLENDRWILTAARDPGPSDRGPLLQMREIALRDRRFQANAARVI